MHGRPAASIDDIKALAKPALRHRLLLSFDAEADRVRPDQVVEQLISELDRRVKG
jgi:MoxR-like ATPase